MEELQKLIEDGLKEQFLSAVISSPRNKDGAHKVKARPVLIKGERLIQIEEHRGTQVFHSNLQTAEAAAKLYEYMQDFKQLEFAAGGILYHVLVSKKGKITITKKPQQKKITDAVLSHNRTKHYILEEGRPVPFLQDLGVMTAEGKVVKGRFDKFRQINRFLEFIEDILPRLDREKEVTILDFGCGKSYLTFAMYYYLHELKQYDIRIIGLDLKTDVIHKCNELAAKYGYEKLTFLQGDIADYEGTSAVDMVVSLHACDTATDYALFKAVSWNAKVILAVPCCQHELNGQMQNEVLAPILSYGLIKERIAALVTDGMRAEYLAREGYDTQILEFIDMEHTPKNILIRAVKTGKKKDSRGAIEGCEEFLHISPTLSKLLQEQGDI